MANFRETPNADKLPVELVGSSTFGRFPKISSAYTLNMFISDDWLISYAGYKKVLNGQGLGGGRALFNSTRGNIMLAVNGSAVYRIDQNLNVIFIGNILTYTGEVVIAENLNNQICLVDGQYAYITNHTLPPNLTPLTLNNGMPPTDPIVNANLIPNYVCFHDTYFLFGNAQTNNNGAQWYAYSTLIVANLGFTAIIGTGALGAGELVVNGIDLAGTYITPQALVNKINTGLITGVFASILGGADISLNSVTGISVKTLGTVGANGLNFANFNTTLGPLSILYVTPSPTLIGYVQQMALQTKPDYAIAVKPIPSQGSNVLVFGTTVCEVHTNVGGAQVYRKVTTINIDFGCLSVATIASSDQYIVWLGVNESNSPVIMVYHGQGAVPISTDGIDYILGRIQYPAESTAAFYRVDGHLFYQLTFFNPVDNLTLAYDFDTKKFYHLSDQNRNFHPAREVVYFNDTSYFISINDGAIFEISTDITNIDFNIETNPEAEDYNLNELYCLPRERITESIRKADSGRFVANSFVFTMAQGDDPAVTGLAIASAYPLPIITEGDFVPPNTVMFTQTNQIILAEQNTQPVVQGAYGPFFAPTELVYRPRVDCTISKDAGTVFGSTVSRYLNPIGNRQNIITFNNMGRANDLTIKLRFWGLGPFVIGQGEVQIY